MSTLRIALRSVAPAAYVALAATCLASPTALQSAGAANAQPKNQFYAQTSAQTNGPSSSQPSVSSNTKPPSTRPTRVRANLTGFDLSAQTGLSPNQTPNGAFARRPPSMAPNQIGGASRGLDGAATLYAPHLGKAYTEHPTFYWGAAEAPATPSAQTTTAAPQPVKFLLVNSSGDTVYETTLTADHLEYPADAPPLSPGEIYRWSVAAASTALDPTTPPAAFVILTGPDRSAIAAELAAISGSGLASDEARAKVFVEHRLWYDAIAAYTTLIAAHPADDSLRLARADLYSQLPVTQPLAVADESIPAH